MLTPAFEMVQDDNFLTVIIRAPYAKISESEVFIEENDFKFYSSPYYLRLTLPGNLVEDSREKADYNASTGVFTIKVPKATPGEHFEGLDMLTKLLAPKGQRTAATPLIQVIDSSLSSEQQSGEGLLQDNLDDSCLQEDFDWSIEQIPFIEQASQLDAPKYGFANQKSGVFQRLQEELQSIVDLPDPDKVPVSERRQLRLTAETDKFDAGDHYIADLYDDEMIEPLLSYLAPWTEILQQHKTGTSIQDIVVFTEEEKERMRNLPRKEYLLDEAEEKLVYLGLVDIVYAYCYNHRTTEGENNVESSWTISKLSSSLSWLEVFNSIQDVIVSSVRRSLCYPLYRHWQLSMNVLNDVKEVFHLGRCQLLKCLLETEQLLMDTESRYILNDLYVTDYCVWIQSVSEVKLGSLAETLNKVTITKQDIGFNLKDIEIEAAALYKEDNSVDNITTEIGNLAVTGEGIHDQPGIGESKGDKLDTVDQGGTTRGGCVDSDDTSSDSSDSGSTTDDSDSSDDSDDDSGDGHCENTVSDKSKHFIYETESSKKQSGQSLDTTRCNRPVEINDSGKLEGITAVAEKRTTESAEQTQLVNNPDCVCIIINDDDQVAGVGHLERDCQDVNDKQDSINNEDDIT